MIRSSHRVANLLLLGVLLLSAGCSDGATDLEDTPDPDGKADPVATPENPLDGFITVAPGVRLHYLDFGGKGEEVLLLAGLGNTANVFRDFAPRLTDRYRVRALTRRGFGESSQPASGYEPPSLANDIRVVLDSLSITKVHLIGHSIAGEEMTRFAADRPSRLGKLVYLDAAYDRTASSSLDSLGLPSQPPPTVADVASRTAFRAYLARVIGVTFPIEEVTSTTRVAADGSLLPDPVTPPAIRDAISDLVERPDYGSVTVPALGLYVIPDSPDDLFPWLSSDSADWNEIQAQIDTLVVPDREEQVARFASEVPNNSVVRYVGGHHYLFLADSERVAAAILSFLAGS